MNIISSDVEINEYKLLGVRLNELVNASKKLDKAQFLELCKQLKEKFKTRCVSIDEELLK